MTLLDSSSAVQVSQLSRATFVAVRASGVSLPRSGDHPAVELGFDDLRVLERMAAGRPARKLLERAGPRAPAVRAFLDVLTERGLLRTPSPEPHGPDLDNPASNAPDLNGPGPEDEAQPLVPDPSGPVAPDDDAVLVVDMPLVLRATPSGFRSGDHEGRERCVLDHVQLDALASFRQPGTWRDALRAHRASAGSSALREARFLALVGELLAKGLLVRYDADDESFLSPYERAKALEQAMVRNHLRVTHHSEVRLREFEADEAARGLTGRTPIVPVQHNGGSVPLGLGMVMAYAKAWEGGRLEEHYSFRPDWFANERPVEELAARPGVYLFSNYVWSHASNLEVSERVKAHSPESLTIHGGPDSPKYPADVEHYFAIHPHIDVVVHGEGEVTLAEVLAALSPAGVTADRSALEGVPGISFRLGDRVVRTADRERVADLDLLPSPYLTGLFLAFADAEVRGAFVETNRGCPYGCTFCDWGSATLSRIRKFDLDRVYAEIEWCARHHVDLLYICDANFGIFERDVEIAEKVAEVKERYGFPNTCFTNYAKNTTKHLRKIIELWTDAGMITNGQLSLQSLDSETLHTIRRKNIKVEKYDELAVEFRKSKLPLYVDLMMGLPGATTESFHADLQSCVDREVVAKIFNTTLLPNSPMNDPAYRAEHRIEVDDPSAAGRGLPRAQFVVSSATFTRDDMEAWKVLRRTYVTLENYGVLRLVARYVRHELGLEEVALYLRLQRDADLRRERYPHLHFAIRSTPGLLAPPGDWKVFVDEVRDYLVAELGITDDSALDAVLRAQHAVLPARGRTFPYAVALAHDVPAWHRAMLDAKEQGPDWTERVPALRTFGPTTMVVTDPQRVCAQGLGDDVENGHVDSWELDSPVSRPLAIRPSDSADDAEVSR